MVCPNCGKEVKEGSKFCVVCGTALTTNDYPQNNQTENLNVSEQSTVITPTTSEIKENVTAKFNDVRETVKKASNGNIMQMIIASLMFLFNVLLKPMKSLKNKIEDYSKPEKACILAGVVAFATMIIRIFTTILMALIDKRCTTVLGSKVCSSTIDENFKNIDWFGITLKHLLIILAAMFAVAGIYYIGSLIAKKTTNYMRLLTITVVAFVPASIAIYLLTPFFGWINVHIGKLFEIVGLVYSLIIFFSAIKDEIKFDDLDKNIYFHLICVSIIVFAAYLIQYNVVYKSVTDTLGSYLNF